MKTETRSWKLPNAIQKLRYNTQITEKASYINGLKNVGTSCSALV